MRKKRKVIYRPRNKEVVLAVVMKREREKRKLSIKDLERILDIPYATLWDWENIHGRSIDDLDRVRKTAKHFGLTESELLFGKDEERAGLLKEVEELRKKTAELENKLEMDTVMNQLSFDQILEKNAELESEIKRLKNNNESQLDSDSEVVLNVG